jgi:hypothetical protein
VGIRTARAKPFVIWIVKGHEVFQGFLLVGRCGHGDVIGWTSHDEE